MNKIDLIIDALIAFDVMAHEQKIPVYIDEAHKALAAARELQALKPVAWVDWSMDGSQYSDTETSYGTPLYALDDEVKDEPN